MAFFSFVIHTTFTQKKGLKKYEDFALKIGTMVHLATILPESARSQERSKLLFQMAYDEIDRLDQIFSRYRSDSEVAKINKSPNKPHKLSSELAYVFEKALSIHKESLQSFDITVLPLIKLWKMSEKANTFPSQMQLQENLSLVGIKNITYNQEKRTLRMKKGMQLDLGGIAKGYLIERIRDIWKKNNLHNGMINIGGDVWALGLNERKQSWALGIQDPENEKNFLKIIKLSDQGMVTSGDYQRYFTINSQKYSHIIDPRNGLPIKGSRSLTLVGSDMLKIDAWATACSILGPDQINSFLPRFCEASYTFLYENNANELTLKSSNIKKAKSLL